MYFMLTQYKLTQLVIIYSLYRLGWFDVGCLYMKFLHVTFNVLKENGGVKSIIIIHSVRKTVWTLTLG